MLGVVFENNGLLQRRRGNRDCGPWTLRGV
jgi:hypothetical protein